MKRPLDTRVWILVDKSVDKITKLIYEFIDLTHYLGGFFKKEKDIEDQAIKNVKGLKEACTVPKSKGFCPNYNYIKCEFLHEDPKELFLDCLTKIPTDKDFSYLDYSKNTLYIQGKKYAAAMFGFKNTNALNKFLETSDGIVDDYVKLSELPNSEEWKNSDKSQRLSFKGVVL